MHWAASALLQMPGVGACRASAVRPPRVRVPMTHHTA